MTQSLFIDRSINVTFDMGYKKDYLPNNYLHFYLKKIHFLKFKNIKVFILKNILCNILT